MPVLQTEGRRGCSTAIFFPLQVNPRASGRWCILDVHRREGAWTGLYHNNFIFWLYCLILARCVLGSFVHSHSLTMGLGTAKRNEDDGDRVLVAGRPDLNRCDNMITTSKYTLYSFLPVVGRHDLC